MLTRKASERDSPLLYAKGGKSFGRACICKVMSVVVLAQMAKEYVAKPRVPESLYGAGAFIVAEVAAALDNPHLEFVCIWTAEEHIHVII